MADTGGPPVSFTLDRRYAPSVQLGLNVKLSEHWFADAVVAKTRLRTVAHLSTGQSLPMRLDPNFTALALGYRF